ncbi:thiamine pyrophosphate-binding protein [Mycobacterium riyadhense]|uniref:thiamine pyrophosphate-binding protein n=1 Tax=Mycobacterium riyadhense TaxID=486698 RepID=UPI00195BB086|nr:thiamine pyrophosphate-binding protein [Mycobacterium riyadhense]
MRSASRAVTTIGDHLVHRMREAGISVLCGLPTSRLDSLLVRVTQDPGFRIVLARHEGGAGYLADGFARASGRPAAVFAAGPGATNVISAVANASVNHVPMLVLTGEVSVAEFGLCSQQDTSDDGLGLGAAFRRLCRCSVSIESVANARSKIDRAFRALVSGPRGPVHIALPRDLVDEPLPVDQIGAAVAGPGAPRILAPCGPELADEVIGRLDRSAAPLLLLGNGCRSDAIHSEIVAFCEQAGLPFATTPNGRGVVPETHPLSLGVLGLFGDGRAEDYLFDTPCDLLIAVGVSFGGLVTRSFSPRWNGLKADVIHVDPDPSAFGRLVETSLGINTSSRAFVESVCSGRSSQPRRRAAVPPPTPLTVPETQGEAIHPLQVMRELDSKLGRTATICADVGTCIYWAFRGIPVRRPGGFFATTDFSPMGCGIAGAIGVALARPNERVICIAGDGAFLMHGTEISTAVAQGIPVTWVILNDGQMTASSGPIQGRMDPAAVGSVARIGANDLAAMASALGAQGIRVDMRAELRAGIEKALAATGPCVLDVAIDPAVNKPDIGVGK